MPFDDVNATQRSRALLVWPGSGRTACESISFQFHLASSQTPDEPTLSYLPSKEVGYYRFLRIPTCYSVWNLAYTKSSHWQWFSLLGEGDVSANAGGAGRFLIGWNREDRCGKWSRGNIHQLPLSSIFFFSSSLSLPPSFPLFRHFSLPSFSILNIYLLLVRLLHNSPLGAASQTILAGLMVPPSCPGMVTWLQENGVGLSGAYLWFLESEHPRGNLIHSRTRTPMFREGAASALERNLMHNKQSITISKERSKFPRLPSRHLDLKPLAPCHPSPSGWTQCCV